jgi:hypothetical protein
VPRAEAAAPPAIPDAPPRGLAAAWPFAVLALLIIACGAVDVWWLRRFRGGGFPLDINESQYMGFGLALKNALATGGVRAAWHAWGAQTQFGPLLPLVSVPVFAVFGERVLAGFAAQLPFFAVLILSSYGLGRRLCSSGLAGQGRGPRSPLAGQGRGLRSPRVAGLLVAVLVAGTPSVIDFTRSYEFPVTAAAVLTACTYALLASEGFTRRRWSLAWGILLGLLPLARTMTIAFVPAQVVAAVWLVLSRPAPRRPRGINLLGGLVLGALVAAIWFVKAWHAQLSYLTNFGYGGQSAHFAHSGSKLSLGYWTRELVNTVQADLYLPLGALVAVSLLLGLLVWLWQARASGEARALRRRAGQWARGDTAVVLLVVVEGYLAVTSSRNEGVGFRVPLLPALLALAVLAVWRLPWRRLATPLLACLLVVAVFDFVMKADVAGGPSGRVNADVPGLGSTPVVDGTGWIQQYILGSLETSYGSATRPLAATQKGWLKAYSAITRDVLQYARAHHVVPNLELTTDEPLLNAYDLSLAAQLHFQRSLITNVLPGPGSDAPSAYRQTVIRAGRAGVNVLLTVSRPGVSYFAPAQSPAAGQELFQEAARQLGYGCTAAVGLPDARLVFIEWRTSARQLRMPGSGAPQPCAPAVQRTLPRAGAQEANGVQHVVVFFTGPMLQAPTERAFALTRAPRAARVRGSVGFFGEQALVFTPAQPLAPGTTFTATVSRSATGATGLVVRRSYRWSFTTR